MNRLQANICMLTVLVCWAFEVILLKNIPHNVPGPAVMTATNFIGFIILFLAFFSRVRKNFTFALWWKICGFAVLNLLYNLLGLESLRYLPTSVCIFQCSTALLVSPFILLALHETVHRREWLGSLLVLAGIFCSLDWNFPSDHLWGLILLMTHAIAWSVYLFYLNRLAKKEDSITIATLILGSVTILGFVTWFVIDPYTIFSLEYSQAFVSSIFADGYFICVLATVLSIFAQKYLSFLDTVAINSLYPAIAAAMALLLPPILVDAIDMTYRLTISIVLVSFGTFVCEADWSKLRQQWLEWRG